MALLNLYEGRMLSAMDRDEIYRAFGRDIMPSEAYELLRWVEDEMRFY